MSKSLLFVLLLAILGLSHVASHEGHSHSHGGVVELNAGSFDAEVGSHPLSLVEFFAPWCGHCKALAPNFATAAAKLGDAALLGSVDCTVEKDLCSRFSVRGYPTLKVFKGDVSSPQEYNGGRQADDIIRYMKKQSQPVVATLADAAAVKAFTEQDGVNVVILSDNTQEFVQTANSYSNDYNFAIATELPADIKTTATSNVILLFKSNGAELLEYPLTAESNTESAIVSFIQNEAFPLIGDIGPENYQKYLERNLPLVWIFYSPEDAAQKSSISGLASAAQANKGKLSLVKLDGVKWAEHSKHFGVPAGQLPALVIEDKENNKNFIYPAKDLTDAAAVKQFFADFQDGKLSANVKSQPRPTSQPDAVITVVGETFDEVVMDDTKDVLVEFYAPWCGHCKSLKPKYEELAESFKDNPSVVIAAVDATENDTPAKIQGFPTLIFYPKGDKSNPIKYEGDRTVEAMTAFINANGGASKASDASAEATEAKSEL